MESMGLKEKTIDFPFVCRNHQKIEELESNITLKLHLNLIHLIALIPLTFKAMDLEEA